MNNIEEEIDVLNDRTSTELSSVTALVSIEALDKQSMDIDGSVSARTDGLRGKRYNDYQIEQSSGTESGELTDSDIDVLGDEEHESKSTPLLGNFIQPSVTHKLKVQQNQSELIAKRDCQNVNESSEDKELRTNDDVKGILSIIKSEPDFDFTSNPGISKLLSAHRPVIPVIDTSDDEDGDFNISDSDSSDEPYKAPMSITSEINKMESMNIKDMPFKETFPEVEIIDLVLSEVEEICSLGTIYQIVEDFVVVKGSHYDQVLDLDSMVFDGKRKCVGYVFEVLGPVREPYYSIHFNTNSDIANLGLHLNQELFYSTNENYSRYVLVEKLRELEFSSRHKQNSQGNSDESDSFSSDSEKEENTKTSFQPKPLAGVKRKPKKQLQNRTTSNYTVNYTSTQKQPRNHGSNKLTKSNPAPRPQRGTYSIWGRGTGHSSHQNNEANQTVPNSFKSSVLASFLDPFSLDKPDS